MDRFGLRPATLADVPEMCRTVAEALATFTAWAPPGWEPPPVLSDAEELRERWELPGFTAYVDAEVTAHVATHRAQDEPDAFHLMHLFARPHRHGTGVAAALLALAVDDARAAGATTMRLRTPEGNARGLRFYAREGWTQHGGPVPGGAVGLPHVWLRRPL